jgi:hypothetical protein
MRKALWLVGLGICSALGACSASTEEEAPGAAPMASAENPAAASDPAPTPNAPSDPNEPSDPSDPNQPSEPQPLAGDAGAPVDGGTEASAPKPQIPKPSQGTLVVTTNTGAMCEWSVGGIIKGTSAKLTTQLYGGTYDVACKRVSDAKVITEKAYVYGSQTTNLELTFRGKVEATSNTPCTWFYAGFVVGSGSAYSAERLPGQTSLECDPADATKSSQTKVIQIVADTTTKVTFTF